MVDDLLPPDEEDDYSGVVIHDKYRIESLLGRGGMGAVWSAVHLELGTRVAVKLIRPQYAEKPDARKRFEIEAKAAAQVDSPHAVRVYDYGLTELGIPFIVMELLEGESLAEAIIRRGFIPLQELAIIVRQAARALEKAHARGIVHRDLKPDNVFLAANREAPTIPPASQTGESIVLPYSVKLVDFGIAKLLDVEGGIGGMRGPTQTGMVIGTPSFMSPEQLTEGGAPDPLVDMWAFGVTVFTAATGGLPFDGEILGDIVLQVCAQPLPVPSERVPSLPKAFDEWFFKACARDRKARFRTATELANALFAVAFPEERDPEVEQYGIAARGEDGNLLPIGHVREVRDSELPDATPRLSNKTALALGVILGLSLIAAIIGAIAWRSQLALEEEHKNAPTAPALTAKPATSGR
ncbi:MAG: serine/threonine-protein kinase [Polyangiaceae bacterium]